MVNLRLDRVAPGQPAWAQVDAFLREQTDPVDDLLIWADVLSPIARISRVWLATDEAGRPLGVAYAFPLWPELPSLGLKALTPGLEQAMLAALVADGTWRRGFVIADGAQAPLYEAHGSLSNRMPEHHMGLAARDWQPREVLGVRPAGLDELDAFYRTLGAGAWNPIQYDTGPYVVAEADGRIVAAAGTHFAYAELAQVGNVLTDPAYRGRGYAGRVTAAVVQALVEQGHPMISLFVEAVNAPAIAVYQRLGFHSRRRLAAFRWDA